MTDYRPIDCGLHSEYELLVMEHRSCRLGWRDPSGTGYSRLVTPTDLYTRNHEEYLQVTDTSGVIHDIRLDRIQHCTPV